jgi:hypothetical protein
MWAAPPGIDAKAVPFERGRHFRGFLVGTLVSVAIGGSAAVLAR